VPTDKHRVDTVYDRRTTSNPDLDSDRDSSLDPSLIRTPTGQEEDVAGERELLKYAPTTKRFSKSETLRRVALSYLIIMPLVCVAVAGAHPQQPLPTSNTHDSAATQSQHTRHAR
jgi:hypothetical protein